MLRFQPDSPAIQLNLHNSSSSAPLSLRSARLLHSHLQQRPDRPALASREPVLAADRLLQPSAPLPGLVPGRVRLDPHAQHDLRPGHGNRTTALSDHFVAELPIPFLNWHSPHCQHRFPLRNGPAHRARPADK